MTQRRADGSAVSVWFTPGSLLGLSLNVMDYLCGPDNVVRTRLSDHRHIFRLFWDQQSARYSRIVTSRGQE
jgi:hypothetical protein